LFNDPVRNLSFTDYKKTPAEVVNSPQGAIDEEKLAHAQAAMDAANAAMQQAIENAELSRQARQHAAEASAAAAETREFADLKSAEAEAAAAVLQAAVDELHRIEEEFNTRLASLDAIGESDKGVVTKNKAKNEAAQMRAEGTLRCALLR
jgi:hypothetical protein